MTNREIVEHRIKIMQAFLDNKEIQHKYDTGEVYGLWYDGLGPKIAIPNFLLYEYRIKPEMVRYKVGLFKNNANCHANLISEDAVGKFEIEKDYFVRWLTGWIEHEDKL